MDIILVPGLWLDASSWDPILPALRDAGHRPVALTMPGVGTPAPGSSDVGIEDWVAATVAAIDAADGPVVVVGHSGGGNVAWGAADARPDRVRRVVLVDTAPPPSGSGISEFAVVDGVIPFPGWDFFDADDVADLDEETRARTAPLMRSVPARVPTDGIVLGDQRRYGIPVSLLMGGLTQEEFEGFLAQWGSYGDEYRAIRDVEVVRIGSGHWPQFSAPTRLAELLVAAVDR
ncbi:pimeloyl-ACP methyl ester carboxylesterase [Microbacterium resistens]|uniref:Pimeloyl-ACP methyl ester carboxylesterase n=1 Tax=Microbacterium resistens TaxID=156977 RepID=A0ABU1SF75_9MICO|nr:alpha/beta fold hydrolase [Microbacterium resistens]MDR6868259.1 pimeloyl-ACP methyl ester carboxylesterase [Microbacterium resistens]